jgi:hypothetical protein
MLILILVLSPFRFEMWYRTPSKSETVMSMDSFLSLKEMNDVRCGVLILTAHWISHWFSLLLATINPACALFILTVNVSSTTRLFVSSKIILIGYKLRLITKNLHLL